MKTVSYECDTYIRTIIHMDGIEQITKTKWGNKTIHSHITKHTEITDRSVKWGDISTSSYYRKNKRNNRKRTTYTNNIHSYKKSPTMNIL